MIYNETASISSMLYIRWSCRSRTLTSDQPTLDVWVSECSIQCFPSPPPHPASQKKDSFIHWTTSTKFCNYYSAQIRTDFNKHVYQLGGNFMTTALAKQIIVTDSFCSSSSPKRAGRQCYDPVPSALPVSNSSEQSVSPIINLCFRKDCFITISTQGTDWPQPEARWQLFPKP